MNERFWERVEVSDTGCWLWTGAKTSDGYGNFRIGDHWTPAHCFAYKEIIGPIPDGLQLDHLCRVRLCVFPLHLEPVTSRENTIRGWEARKEMPCRPTPIFA